ncbi:MAG TPA: rhamnulokinase family protein [Erysipelotrichaceae bacterium]|mgnify:CR=1 FL=1|jgi:rhamnulokinase|nr:rhamnulokinase [Erysipelotrichia bacterium]HPX32872.1 rhamnulokinase family protein [Erysipelotrichaceae bacterium]HQA84729.1 rhamnulokinase family protein [Erysipelotrichaceae bacterium]
MKYYLAIDIGASSGRHIVGWKKDEQIHTEELYRFDNGVIEKDNHLIWDVEYLLSEIKKGITIVKKRYNIESLSIATWGVDYVLMKEGQEVFPVYSYRDNRTERIINEVHSIIPFEELYQRTGSQYQPFNTIYQLYDDKKQGRLKGVTDFLMMPEYLLYKLTGVKKKEFTNATTTGMINHESLMFDEMIINKLGMPKILFKKLYQPKEMLGYYDGIKVVLCATHDTASAVEGIPMRDNELYISSGTWSLLGVKTEKPITDINSMKANYSNEGGVGYNRYQKNIMGLWLVNELKKELCPNENIRDIVEKASKSSFEEIINANDSSLLAPESMKDAFDKLLKNKPESIYDYFRCAYNSLALSYKKAIEELEKNTGKTYFNLYIVGGGAKNSFLNSLTEKETGKKVIALPIEATAIGNIKMQMW